MAVRAPKQRALLGFLRGVVERARLYRSYVSVWTEGKSPLAHLAATEHAAQ